MSSRQKLTKKVDLKLDHFKDEMQESYGHLKKAFKSL